MNINTTTEPPFLKILITIIKKEALLIIASLLAIITSFFSLPKIEYIDFKVLILLFNLMIVVAAFKKLKIFDALAISVLSKCTSYRSISFTLVFLTFFAAMIITNDVALITFVPLTLIVANKAKINSLKIIIFQTLAANLGSSLTPMGNPQNLFIYSFFNINPLEFFKITLPLVMISFAKSQEKMSSNHSALCRFSWVSTSILITGRRYLC
jgi:Na+/H+ antiporter NhaD/arsenite permease-like protein